MASGHYVAPRFVDLPDNPAEPNVGTRSRKDYSNRLERLNYKKQLRRKWMGRVHLMTLDDLDHRSKAYRKAQALFNELVDEYGHDGDLSFEQRQHANSIALLTAWIEDIAVRSFIGEKVDKNTCAALINTRRKEMATL
jgi:hypothetical protein